MLDFFAISFLQRRETPHIKRLKLVGRVRQYTESDDLTVLAKLTELQRVVALMAVDYGQPVFADSTILRMPVKVL